MPPRRSVTITAAWIGIIGVFIIAIVTIAVPFIERWLTQGNSSQEIEYIGRVIDTSSQQTIAGAKVSLDLENVPPIVYTDSEGVYRFKLSIKAEVGGQVRVEAQGYETYVRNISLFPNISNIEDIRLTPQTATLIPINTAASSTITPTSAPTSTFTPTLTPTNTPLAPEDYGGLIYDCIPDAHWKLTALTVTPQADGCLPLAAWGLHADYRALKIILPSQDVRGLIDKHLFLPVSGNVDISFRIKIHTISGEFTGDKVPLLSVGICNRENADNETNSIMYSYRPNGSVLWGIIDNDYHQFASSDPYSLETAQEFIFQVRAYDLVIKQKTLQNNELLIKEIWSNTLPPEALSALCIRYTLPVLGELTATIDNFLVEEK